MKSFKNTGEIKLQEICHITYGKGLPTKHLKEFGYPVFGANGIIGFNDKYLFEESQVLISCRGAYSGKVNYSPPQCFITNNSLIVEILDQSILNKKYLFYSLQAVNKSRLVTGTAQPQVTINNAIELSIPLPPLSEQHRIVEKIEELFSELDNGIANLKEAKEQLTVYRQSLLKWAFEGRLTNEETKDGELPEGWKWVTIGDTCRSVEYGSSAKSDDDGKVPVIRMGNIQAGLIDWSDLKYSSNELEIQKYLLRPNDVLFNRTNSPELVGKTAIYKGERPAIYAGYLIRINIIEEFINAYYLNYFLNSEYAKWYGNSVKTDGVNQSNINGQKLKSYPIPIAPLTEQVKIVEEIETRFSVADKLEQSIDESLLQAEALRQSILKSAIEGRLVS
jgi:type I restriction enzyme, S subunit